MATKRVSKAAKAASPTKSLLHEANGKGQHRIVILVGGKPDQSAWFERHEVAHYKGYFASVDWDSPLPQGIFRLSLQTYERLAPRRVEIAPVLSEKTDEIGGSLG